MLKEDDVIGAVVIYRQEIRPFSERQLELIRSFASQAVIAIENVRLLNELRARTSLPWLGTLIGVQGRVEEVAYASLFLASDEASYITGTKLVFDGGYLAM
jgi:GAF domain-containing protein